VLGNRSYNMFDNCTVKYHKNLYSGIVDSVIVTYPTIKDKDGVDSWRRLCVPMEEDSSDYRDILEWVAKGNTIEEAD
jgi:hypothetical protein